MVSCIAWRADQAKSQPQEEITNEILGYTKTQECEEKLLCKAKLRETKKEEEKAHLQKIKGEEKMLKSKETNLLPCTFGNKLYKDLLRNRKYVACWKGDGGRRDAERGICERKRICFYYLSTFKAEIVFT